MKEPLYGEIDNGDGPPFRGESEITGYSIRPVKVVVGLLAFVMMLEGCGQSDRQPAPSSEFFVPVGARNFQQRERGGIREVSYEITAQYPASPFLCELTSHLDREQWRGLREDALNPGSESSLVRGWGDYGNATRQPETHVHAWMAQWRNQDGDLLVYGLKYEYPATTAPEMTTLAVSAVRWPANLVRAQLGPRTDELPALQMPALLTASAPPADRHCQAPEWSEFVNSTSGGAPPVPALPFELAHVRSLLIEHDIDGLAARIAATLRAQVPDLRVSTLHDVLVEGTDATLNFRFECRCNQAGLPNGFYVREAVLYKPAVQRDWTEPARVFFYWSDNGEPAWKSQVPPTCVGQAPLSPSCKAAFHDADIGFAGALVSALTDARAQR